MGLNKVQVVGSKLVDVLVKFPETGTAKGIASRGNKKAEVTPQNHRAMPRAPITLALAIVEQRLQGDTNVLIAKVKRNGWAGVNVTCLNQEYGLI
jgi:hypothetical protein